MVRAEHEMIQELAYSTLDRWEREGEWPDPEEFNAMVDEVKRLRMDMDRLQQVIDACQEAEHLRRSRSANWQPWRSRSLEGTTDSFDDF
jgi:hypothetical protein